MDALHFSAYNEAIVKSLFANNGYEKQYTFFGDLAIADWYGKKSINDTFKNICNNWKGSIKAFTEFVMCLNYRCWMYYDFAERGALDDIEKQNKDLADTFKKMPMLEYSQLYADLYHKAYNRVFQYFKDEEDIAYFLRVTD